MKTSQRFLSLALATAASVLFLATAGASAKPTVIAHATPQLPQLPARGQFLYEKFKRVELRGWVPGGGGVMGGTIDGFPGGESGFNALLATTGEWWTAADGAGRIRELATPRFFSDAERSRWQAAGSPAPAPAVTDRRIGALAKFHFPNTSRFPIDPHQLHLAIEFHHLPWWNRKPNAKPLDPRQTLEALWNIVVEGPTSPQLRAAVFNAMAELPGAELDRKAADLVGRHGYSFVNESDETGTRSELIFDPETSRLLGERTVLVDPTRSPGMSGLPAGLTIRDTAFLKSSLVDSTDER